MKAVEIERDDLIKESQRLYRNISRRLKRIQEIEKAPEYALINFRKLQEKYPRDIRKLDDKELKSFYRQVKYIDELKSSRIENINKMKETWTPIEEALKIFSKEAKDKFWEIYGKIYENAPNERYKYDVFSVIQQKMMYGEDVDDIAEQIIDLYWKTTNDYSEVDENEFSIRFTDRLYELL